MKNIYIYQLRVILLFVFSFVLINLHSQLNVTGGVSGADLADALTADGVEISNVVLNCPTGGSGTFSNGNSTNIGLDAGVLLTSGCITNAPGPNSVGNATCNHGAPGDGDLTAFAGYATRDACVLEFDVIPQGNTISFNYVFASEEYEEWFCTSFNDVFAFLVSGPNPGGGNYLNENIALIPGGTLPVTINNVGPGTCNGVNNSGSYISNAGGATIEYDGFTVTFTATIDVMRCQSYHFKLAVADGSDNAWDSGVFLEAGSFASTAILAEAVITPPDCPGGCDGSIDLSVLIGAPPYNFLWDNGEITEDLSGLCAGDYSVVITDNDLCSEEFTFSVPDGIDDEAPTTVCKDIIIQLEADGTTSIAEDAVDDGSTDNCGIASYDTDITDFDCVDAYEYLQNANPVSVVLTVTDIHGNSASCNATVTVLYSDNDSDCDGVGDECDVCENGDDSVDANGDGLPDCANYMGPEGLAEDWYCSKNNKNVKIFVCHIPEDNPDNYHTICISVNAVQEHIDSGDWVGPCVDCEEGALIQLPSNGINTANSELKIFPNPSSGELQIMLNDLDEGMAEIKLMDNLGKEVWSTKLADGSKTHNLKLDLKEIINSELGVYYISVIQNNEVTTKPIVVIE